MDVGYMLEYLPLYVDTAILTISIGLSGIILALTIGFICAYILYFRIAVAKRIVSCYIELSRF